MTNVLFVSHSSELNGAERMLLDTIRGLDRRKFSPLLAVPRPGPLTEAAAGAGIEYVFLPMKWTLTERAKVWKQPFSRVWNIRGRERRRGSSAVAGSASSSRIRRPSGRAPGPPGGRAFPTSGSSTRSSTAKDRSFDYVFGRKALVRRMIRLSNRIVANSEASARAFKASGKAVVIGNGVAAREGPPPDMFALRSALGIEPGTPVVGVVGKIYPGKGQLEAVLAADILRRARPDLRLLVVGGVDDARYDAMIYETVMRLGLERNVVFLGYRDDLDLILACSTSSSSRRRWIPWVASLSKPWPPGRPSSPSRRVACRKWSGTARPGSSSHSPEPELLAAGIARILDDPELARRLCEGGRKFVVAELLPRRSGPEDRARPGGMP